MPAERKDDTSLFGKYAELIKTIGFPITMCLVFIFWETGLLPSKTKEVSAAIQKHDEYAKSLMPTRIEIDRQLADALRGLRDELRRSNNTNKAIVCEQVKDARIRQLCME